MSNLLLFQMWGPYRLYLIDGHKFYVHQARKRLLSQFEDIGGEADIAAGAWLKEMSHSFNPDIHDPGAFYESANDVSIEFYKLLSDMRDRTRLSIVAGMYHEWDKQLRQWLTEEIGRWHYGKCVVNKIWKVSFAKLLDFLESLDWRIRDNHYFDHLNACRLVVNVYKHGDGDSFKDLKAQYPEYLAAPLDNSSKTACDYDFTDHSHLTVSDVQLETFSEAIIAFWKDVPENIYHNENLTFPDWFQNAFESDQKSLG